MSRSVRKYKGLLHTQSNTKQGKVWKKLDRRRTRARAKVSEDGIEEAKRCARGNCYDGLWMVDDSELEDIAARRSPGYSKDRVRHRLLGK